MTIDQHSVPLLQKLVQCCIEASLECEKAYTNSDRDEDSRLMCTMVMKATTTTCDSVRQATRLMMNEDEKDEGRISDAGELMELSKMLDHHSAISRRIIAMYAKDDPEKSARVMNEVQKEFRKRGLDPTPPDSNPENN